MCNILSDNVWYKKCVEKLSELETELKQMTESGKRMLGMTY